MSALPDRKIAIMDERSLGLKKQYENRFEGVEEYRNGVWRILCNKFFSKYTNEQTVILDLGAGHGEFSRNINAGKKYAMDLNPDTGKILVDHAEFLNQDCSQAWQLQDESLDVVFTSNFFEHLPSKDLIDNTLSEAFRCLKPGGKIICMGPNIKYVPGRYWDFWDHYTPITDLSMAEALELSDFRVTERIVKFIPYEMSHGWKPPLFMVSLYLKMPFAWRLFGKQFLLVGEKPQSAIQH